MSPGGRSIALIVDLIFIVDHASMACASCRHRRATHAPANASSREVRVKSSIDHAKMGAGEEESEPEGDEEEAEEKDADEDEAGLREEESVRVRGRRGGGGGEGRRRGRGRSLGHPYTHGTIAGTHVARLLGRVILDGTHSRFIGAESFSNNTRRGRVSVPGTRATKGAGQIPHHCATGTADVS